MLDSIPELSFRPLEAGSYAQTVALWSRCDGIGTPEPPDLFARFLARNSGCSQSAWAGERLVGAMLVGFDGKRAYCYHLAVDPEFRRFGVARTMLSRALEVVRQEGVEKATIFLLRDNAVGRSFWEGMGWIERDNLIIFQMPLDSPDASSC
ncbi:MAG TPA: GNAT family N-acetyltransferase [Pirellulaceae bacterium]|jgi:ribosomal protein S18 acetylase RimI-like enzyme|nr:GNAT family N-acetyltransferase [Pirellulaceae bacterium]